MLTASLSAPSSSAGAFSAYSSFISKVGQAEGGAAGAAGLLWNALVGGLMLFFLCSTIQEVARQR